jgi:hypothetical protein
MKLIKLSELFEIKNGNGFELINMEEAEKSSTSSCSFISRTEKKNGISAIVEKNEIAPFPPGTITVAVGGSVLSTFVQEKPYYTGFHIQVLFPKKLYSDIEMQFYAYCIRKNKYRCNYGRQANKTLKDILIPEELPKEWKDLDLKKINTFKKNPGSDTNLTADTNKWQWFNLIEYFDISASRDKLSDDLIEGGKTPYITSSETNNGVTSFFEGEATNKAGTITANRGGSVGYFFYQPVAYMATPVDVRILTPKFNIDVYIGLFIKTILQLEKYRYNYSRKMGSDRLKEFRIKLPSKNNQPDWDFMRNYIKSLPYSANL